MSNLSILLHGNTNRMGENMALSATGYFQNYLIKQKGGDLGEMTWLIRHLLTPFMAAVELPVRVFQCALVTFVNLLTGSFLQSKDLSASATWYNKAAARVREENWHLLACAIGAFVSIFDPILCTLFETLYTLWTLLSHPQSKNYTGTVIIVAGGASKIKVPSQVTNKGYACGF